LLLTNKSWKCIFSMLLFFCVCVQPSKMDTMIRGIYKNGLKLCCFTISLWNITLHEQPKNNCSFTTSQHKFSSPRCSSIDMTIIYDFPYFFNPLWAFSMLWISFKVIINRYYIPSLPSSSSFIFHSHEEDGCEKKLTCLSPHHLFYENDLFNENIVFPYQNQHHIKWKSE